MTWLYISAGLLVRIVGLMLERNSPRPDVFFLGWGLVLGLLASFRDDSWLALPIALTITAAFVLKDNIIPTVNEGLLLFYSFIGLFLAYQSVLFNGVEVGFWSGLLLGYFITLFLLMFFLCLVRIRLSSLAQFILLYNFIFTSGYITYQTIFSLLLDDLHPINLILIGYFILSIASGIIYLYYFIPIPVGEHQTKAERIKEVKGNIESFQEKYLDKDAHYLHTVAIAVLVVILVSNEWLMLFDWQDVLLPVLFVGTFLLTQKHKAPKLE